ncbi:unnamed protein product [Clavelina lepadiformis]|uniref:Uncharacterized protein n=2 Tax=Clavelina lepadiformis TaxID=159417 RepID=A0ABP0GIQ8_CLALP
MECHPDNVQVGVLLKAISDMISQDFKSMRLDMEMEETKETETMNNAMSHQRNITTISVRSQMEFAKVQKNMDDMASKILAETKKVEIINNASPIEETSQPLDIEPANGICIEQVYSEEAPVLPLIETVKEESLLLEEFQFSPTESDNPSISILNKFPPLSKVE